MTRKKMIAIILLVIFVFFGGATYLNFLGARRNALSEMISEHYASVLEVRESIDSFNKREEKNFDDLHESLRSSAMFNSYYEHKAYSYVLTDRQGNVICKSESGIWFWHEGDTKYISLEEYMTPEIKADLLEFKETVDGDFLLAYELNLNFNGEEFIPVSIGFGDNHNPLKGEMEYLSVKFTDLEITHSFDGGDGLTCELYNLEDDESFNEVEAKLEEELNSFDYSWNAQMSNTIYSVDAFFPVIETVGDYHFIGFAKYDSLHKALSSNYFNAQMGTTVEVFVFLTAAVLIASIKLFNKSRELKENQRVFTSAAAHELKTPLAVIQNQCECIMEGIAPEKNEKYVKSIYDEAVRMNEIVKTLLLFNRVSNTDRIEKSNCNLSEIVVAELQKYEAYAQSKQIKLKLDTDENVFVNANVELIALAVDNYLSNAIKYASGEKNVEISLKKDGNDFVFAVYNDCAGISDSDNVWEVLTKGDKSRSSDRNSTGMGLPICSRIFELHSFKCYYVNNANGVSFVFGGKRVK